MNASTHMKESFKNQEPASGPDVTEKSFEIKGIVPEDVLRNFDAAAILGRFREAFVESLRHFDISTLVGYIAASRRDLVSAETLSPLWREQILAARDETSESIRLLNPRLYFLSAEECGEYALAELLRRISEGTIDQAA